MAILETRRQKETVIVIGVYALTLCTLWTTFRKSHSFLQWTIKLNQGFSFIIICAFVLVNFLLIWQGLTTLLFGELRLIEQEHIFERLPLIVIPMVMIVSQFNSSQIFNVLIFTVGFLMMQVFTWILRDRLEGLLQTINEHTTFTKLLFSNFIRNMIIFAILNYFTTKYTFFDNLKQFYNDLNSTNFVLITFGYNFTSILIQYLNLLLHTILNFYAFYYNQSSRHSSQHNTTNFDSDEIESDDDDDDEQEFEGKFIYEKYIDFITKLFDVILDLTFGIPFKFRTFYIKDLVMDTVVLVKRGVDISTMWKNNAKLNDKLPDIIPEDLIDHDNICIVCMDDLVELSHERRHKVEVNNGDDQHVLFTQEDINSMSKNKRPKILPCGHMLHFSCLKHWMERSQTCPTCRLSVFDENGNVKPVKHHRPPQRDSSLNDSEVKPSPTPTQGTHILNESSAGMDSTTDSNTTTHPTSASQTTTTATTTTTTMTTTTTDSQRNESYSTLDRRMSRTQQTNRPLKYGEWSTFEVKEQNEDGSNVKFEVKDNFSRKKQIELIVTPNENLQNSIITIPDIYLEGRRHL